IQHSLEAGADKQPAAYFDALRLIQKGFPRNHTAASLAFGEVLGKGDKITVSIKPEQAEEYLKILTEVMEASTRAWQQAGLDISGDINRAAGIAAASLDAAAAERAARYVLQTALAVGTGTDDQDSKRAGLAGILEKIALHLQTAPEEFLDQIVTLAGRSQSGSIHAFLALKLYAPALSFLAAQSKPQQIEKIFNALLEEVRTAAPLSGSNQAVQIVLQYLIQIMKRLPDTALESAIKSWFDLMPLFAGPGGEKKLLRYETAEGLIVLAKKQAGIPVMEFEYGEAARLNDQLRGLFTAEDPGRPGQLLVTRANFDQAVVDLQGDPAQRIGKIQAYARAMHDDAVRKAAAQTKAPEEVPDDGLWFKSELRTTDWSSLDMDGLLGVLAGIQGQDSAAHEARRVAAGWINSKLTEMEDIPRVVETLGKAMDAVDLKSKGAGPVLYSMAITYGNALSVAKIPDHENAVRKYMDWMRSLPKFDERAESLGELAHILENMGEFMDPAELEAASKFALELFPLIRTSDGDAARGLRSLAMTWRTFSHFIPDAEVSAAARELVSQMKNLDFDGAENEILELLAQAMQELFMRMDPKDIRPIVDDLIALLAAHEGHPGTKERVITALADLLAVAALRIAGLEVSEESPLGSPLVWIFGASSGTAPFVNYFPRAGKFDDVIGHLKASEDPDVVIPRLEGYAQGMVDTVARQTGSPAEMPDLPPDDGFWLASQLLPWEGPAHAELRTDAAKDVDLEQALRQIERVVNEPAVASTLEPYFFRIRMIIALIMHAGDAEKVDAAAGVARTLLPRLLQVLAQLKPETAAEGSLEVDLLELVRDSLEVFEGWKSSKDRAVSMESLIRILDRSARNPVSAQRFAAALPLFNFERLDPQQGRLLAKAVLKAMAAFPTGNPGLARMIAAYSEKLASLLQEYSLEPAEADAASDLLLELFGRVDSLPAAQQNLGLALAEIITEGAPARREDHEIKMREVLRGITSVNGRPGLAEAFSRLLAYESGVALLDNDVHRAVLDVFEAASPDGARSLFPEFGSLKAMAGELQNAKTDKLRASKMREYAQSLRDLASRAEPPSTGTSEAPADGIWTRTELRTGQEPQDTRALMRLPSVEIFKFLGALDPQALDYPTRYDRIKFAVEQKVSLSSLEEIGKVMDMMRDVLDSIPEKGKGTNLQLGLWFEIAAEITGRMAPDEMLPEEILPQAKRKEWISTFRRALEKVAPEGSIDPYVAFTRAAGVFPRLANLRNPDLKPGIFAALTWLVSNAGTDSRGDFQLDKQLSEAYEEFFNHSEGAAADAVLESFKIFIPRLLQSGHLAGVLSDEGAKALDAAAKSVTKARLGEVIDLTLDFSEQMPDRRAAGLGGGLGALLAGIVGEISIHNALAVAVLRLADLVPDEHHDLHGKLIKFFKVDAARKALRQEAVRGQLHGFLTGSATDALRIQKIAGYAQGLGGEEMRQSPAGETPEVPEAPNDELWLKSELRAGKGPQTLQDFLKLTPVQIFQALGALQAGEEHLQERFEAIVEAFQQKMMRPLDETGRVLDVMRKVLDSIPEKGAGNNLQLQVWFAEAKEITDRFRDIPRELLPAAAIAAWLADIRRALGKITAEGSLEPRAALLQAAALFESLAALEDAELKPAVLDGVTFLAANAGVAAEGESDFAFERTLTGVYLKLFEVNKGASGDAAFVSLQAFAARFLQRSPAGNILIDNAVARDNFASLLPAAAASITPARADDLMNMALDLWDRQEERPAPAAGIYGNMLVEETLANAALRKAGLIPEEQRVTQAALFDFAALDAARTILRRDAVRGQIYTFLTGSATDALRASKVGGYLQGLAAEAARQKPAGGTAETPEAPRDGLWFNEGAKSELRSGTPENFEGMTPSALFDRLLALHGVPDEEFYRRTVDGIRSALEKRLVLTAAQSVEPASLDMLDEGFRRIPAGQPASNLPLAIWATLASRAAP
ncbi:MAG TPA: hypothetical protein VL688_04025, partial [Verrucomicrobiae bacterium]|nr:hypothetical protein [Verrucomicrobiae bacterium]